MQADAYAKLNLGLRVRSPGRSGLHPLVSLVQSIDWADTLTVERSGDDRLEAEGGAVPLDRSNLVWRAIGELRTEAGGPPVTVRLEKRIPVAAGLGGGSADAAAALRLYAPLAGVPLEVLPEIGARVGADVPFCLVGGLAWMEGLGERITPVPDADTNYAVAVVTPPVELSAARVYRVWDELGGPDGPPLRRADVPPGLREFGTLANDLYPAACRCAPVVAEWRAELTDLWGRSVAMTGSGPSLFAFFQAADEAAEAVAAVPAGARARRSVTPVSRGLEVTRR